VIKQLEQGIVFRFGRVREHLRGPGLTMLVPGVDRLKKVNLQIVTLPIPAQDGITRDNVTLRVDAVVYFKVVDPVRAVVHVEDHRFAILQVAQTSLRSIIGKSQLDDLLSNRERLNQGLELMIDTPALGWGVDIDRVEIKDVALPEGMKRSMSPPAALRLRLLQTIVEVAAERNSTLVLPFPVELLRFPEKSSDALDQRAAQLKDTEPSKPEEQLPG
jgi:regulator of protease activity HflC (stomatin/prohibitin superfamily)